jgi:hypothetical protein
MTYEINQGWKPVPHAEQLSFGIVGHFVTQHLSSINRSQRRTDIFMGRPRRITHDVRLEMPCAWGGDGWHHVHEAPGVRYTDRLNIDGSTMINCKDLVIDSWTVPAAQTEVYNGVVAKLAENTLNVFARERFGKIRPISSPYWKFNLNSFAAVALVFFLLSLLSKALSSR